MKFGVYLLDRSGRWFFRVFFVVLGLSVDWSFWRGRVRVGFRVVDCVMSLECRRFMGEYLGVMFREGRGAR